MDAVFDELEVAGSTGGVDDFIDVVWTLRDHAGDVEVWQMVDRWLGTKR